MSNNVTLIKGELAVDKRTWRNRDNSISVSYSVRIRQKSTQSYYRKALKAKTLPEAQKEAMGVYASLQTDLKSTLKMSARREGIKRHMKSFVDDKQKEADGALISQRRVEVIRHHLLPLERFWIARNKCTVDELIRNYETEYRGFRTSERELTMSSRMSEEQTHRLFFKWLLKRRLCSVALDMKVLEKRLRTTNKPFPMGNYRKLLKYTEKEISNAGSAFNRYQLSLYYHVILVMANIGCRVPELRNMKWSDLTTDGDEHRLFIHGKGKERQIVISPKVKSYFERVHVLQDQNQIESKYIWAGFRTKRPFVRISTEIKNRLFEGAGVNPHDFEFVCLRHMFVVSCLNRNVNTLAISRYIGTSQKMIEDTYGGLVNKEVYDIVFKGVSEAALADNKRNPQFLELPDRDSYDA